MDVLDLYGARNEIVHEGRLGLSADQESQASWFITTWLFQRLLIWFAAHPQADLATLDAEIAALPTTTDE
jgi:hypothetical protein